MYYMVNRKFILPDITEYMSYGYISSPDYVRIRCCSRGEDQMDDIHLALCHLTGTPPPNEYKDMFSSKIRDMKLPWGEWGEWGFFRIKGFKKGTMHFEFKDEEVWAKFNQAVASARGWQVGSTTHAAKNRKKK